MFNIAPQIMETVLADETLADDFDELATRCIIGLQTNMAELNGFLLSTRGKKTTDKRREVSTGLIANLLFYTAIIIHLNDLPPDLFDMAEDAEDNSVFDETAMFDEAYFHSPLMLGTHLLGVCADLGEYMWSEKFNKEDDEPDPDAVEATTSSDLEIPKDPGLQGFMETLLDGMDADGGEDDTFYPGNDQAEPMICRLLAGLMIMADLCDIDLGVCMYNASQQTEI